MTTINTNSANRSYTITGLTNDVTYRVRVAAVNSIGVGPFTDYVLATPSLFAIDDNYHNVELLLSMDEVINGDSYYGNDVFILGTTQYGPNDDPYSLETKLLLHGDGISIVDSSLSNKTISRSANTVVTTSDSKFGTASIKFTGNDYLTIGSSDDFNVGTGDFTVEFFVKFNTINAHNPLCNTTTDPNTANNGKWYINYNTTTGLHFGRHATSNIIAAPWTASTDTWYHIAILRDSGTIKIFIDGVEQSVSDNTIFNNVNFDQSGFSIGKVASLTGFDGQIDEFRFTKGIARNITLPSTAYPNPSNPFVDLSSNPKNITVLGSPSIVPYDTTQPPNNIVVTSPSNGTLTFAWDSPSAPPGSTNHIIEYSTDGGVVWTTPNIANFILSNNGFTINNLSNGSYIFRIAAINGSLQSSWSTIEASIPLEIIPASYLLVAGGGGGGGGQSGFYGTGGGGAGGLLHNTNKTFLANTVYNIIIGAGGTTYANGNNSTISATGANTSIAYGGGTVNTSGGSGGGGGHSNPADQGGPSIQTNNDGGIGYGNKGGAHVYINPYPCGGGGGAGEAGVNGQGSTPGRGGNGLQFNITGTDVTYGGGGGANQYNNNNAGVGGSGGGGAGVFGGTGVSGGTNTGGGGGAGGGSGTTHPGGTGGSGVAIIRSSNANAVTTGSPTISTDGNDTVYMFTGSGSIMFSGNNGVPSTPNNIIASSNQQQDLVLSWDSVNGATDYVVEYSTNNGVSWTTVNDGVSSNNSATISGLADGNYYFRVAAVNNNGQGGWKAKYIEWPGIPVQYLVIAGGGGASSAYHAAGAGGAGGYRSNIEGESSGGGASAEPEFIVVPGVTYNIIVGSGGAGGNSSYGGTAYPGNNGSNSMFGQIESIGGGGGGEGYQGTSGAAAGYNGGSGGGGHFNVGGLGTVGQGHNGGTAISTGNFNDVGGGGGGAGSAANAQDGGNGLVSYITGVAVGRAGGGGGGADYRASSNPGTVSHGGGIGAKGQNVPGNGTENTGGGGGGRGFYAGSYQLSGGSGGSGVVIIKSPQAAVSVTGSPTIININNYTIYTFTGTGSITF